MLLQVAKFCSFLWLNSIPLCVYTYIRAYTLMYTHTFKHTSIHTYIYVHIYTYIHTYIHTFIGDWNAKVGSQETPGVTGKFGLRVQNEAGQRLIEFCQENTLVTANTLFQQHKRRLYTWTSPDSQHRNQTDYILCSQRWRSSIQSATIRPEADCGSNHEILIAKFRLKLKKVGKTTRPFKYHLNQIPYDIQWKWEIDLRD